MKKKLIVLDFDHTVFHTTLFVTALKKRFAQKFAIDEDVFMAARNAVKDCCVVIDIDRFISKLPHTDKAAMHSAIHDVIQTQASSFVFVDVKRFLARHHDHFDVLILTHGDQELQTEKILHSGLPEYVQYAITTRSKAEVLAPYINKYSVVYFFDDKAKNIDEVKQKYPSVTTYFVRRVEDHPYGDVASLCECADITIGGLEDIVLS